MSDPTLDEIATANSSAEAPADWSNPAPPGARVQSSSAAPLETDSEASSQSNADDDNDSGFGDWRSLRTQSLTSSTVDFQYENGRRYHAYRAGEYHLPNDENEQDRLDLQHHVFRTALDGRLYLAPIAKANMLDVLDVGCGTGMWCIDMADDISHAEVLGFDLSPIQPDLVPPNCKFLVDDCNSDWVFGKQFDLIHTRAMTPGIKGWPKFLKQAYDSVKPGGYLELHEVSLPMCCTEATADPKPYFVQWSEKMLEGAALAGLDLNAPKKLETLLPEAGFVNVQIQWHNWPIGMWAKGKKNKHIGHLWGEDVKIASQNSGAMFTRVLGWTQEEFDELAANCGREIDEQKKHMWIEICFAYAQKPVET